MRAAAMRRHLITIAFAAAAIALLSSHASDAQKPKLEKLVAVVHPELDEPRLGKSDLKNIYLGRQTRWSDGTPIEPYNRPVRGDAGFAFFRNVLQMTPAKFRYHWQGRQLSGRGTAPPTIATAKKIAGLASRLKGGIGYVTESEAAKLKPYATARRIKLIPID
jgi:ABC-type phosphate transport system substrate-binding protein